MFFNFLFLCPLRSNRSNDIELVQSKARPFCRVFLHLTFVKKSLFFLVNSADHTLDSDDTQSSKKIRIQYNLEEKVYLVFLMTVSLIGSFVSRRLERVFRCLTQTLIRARQIHRLPSPTDCNQMVCWAREGRLFFYFAAVGSRCCTTAAPDAPPVRLPTNFR